MRQPIDASMALKTRRHFALSCAEPFRRAIAKFRELISKSLSAIAQRNSAQNVVAFHINPFKGRRSAQLFCCLRFRLIFVTISFRLISGQVVLTRDFRQGVFGGHSADRQRRRKENHLIGAAPFGRLDQM